MQNYISYLLLTLFFLLSAQRSFGASDRERAIFFRKNSYLLLPDYKKNGTTIRHSRNEIKCHLSSIIEKKAHLRLTAVIHRDELVYPNAINLYALRASAIRSFLMKNHPSLDITHFAFQFVTNNDWQGVRLSLISAPIVDAEENNIYFTFSDNIDTKEANRSLYGNRIPTSISANDSNKPDKLAQDKTDDNDKKLRIFYRFDQSKLDSTYLSNAATLQEIGRLILNRPTLSLDSVHITAYSSPEGHPNYNQRLSERRAATLRNYLIETYPLHINPNAIVVNARGENWEGLRQMAEQDTALPHKSKLIEILDNSTLSNETRQREIEQLESGTLYHQYLKPNYYRYLRSGASLFLGYQRIQAHKILHSSQPYLSVMQHSLANRYTPPSFDSIHRVATLPMSHTRYYRPLALKTNLLFDIASALNIEVEVPIAPRWSIVAEWNFPWWLWEEKQYCLEVLSGSLEARYWIKPNYSKQNNSLRSHNPLSGWFVGIYGGAGDYDMEWGKEGYQGTFWNAGITGGYSVPISRNINIELSLGVGYFDTKWTRYVPQQDVMGEWHLIYHSDGRTVPSLIKPLGIIPTKAKIAFIWYPHFKIRN